MKIITNVSSNHEHNAQYHAAVEGAVQSIFQHQSIGSIGYVAARTSRKYRSKTSSDMEFQTVVPDIEQLARFDVSGLGEYEKEVFARLALGKYPTTVLRGEMGSGKSSAIDNIVAALRRERIAGCGLCTECSPIVIKLNFNAGYDSDDPKVLVKEFKQDLYSQLRQELRRIFSMRLPSDETLSDRLRACAMHDPENLFSAFDLFAQLHENNIQWDRLSDSQKANEVFSYVDECTKHGTERLTVLMRLVYLVKKELRSDPACLILVFDNIDSIISEAQFLIFKAILKYQGVAQTQALVALRWATFQTFENEAALAFGTVDHLGPDVKEILVRRLTYYRENWNNLQEISAIKDFRFRNALRERLDYVFDSRDDLRGGVQRLANLCGASVRQGLYTAERFFINSLIPWDSPPYYPDQLISALLTGESKNNQIASTDLSIANLFLNPDNGEASLLNLRVLQLIYEFEDDASNRRLSKLIEMLRIIGNWTDSEIRTSLNYLLNMRRPLLWVDGRTQYTQKEMTSRVDDVLHLTEAGEHYLRELILELDYVQEAGVSVRWPDDSHIPSTADFSRMIDRFVLLRCILDHLAAIDRVETVRFKEWLSSRRVSLAQPALITSRMIGSIARSILAILLKSMTDGFDAERLNAYNELKNWQSLVVQTVNKETEMVKSLSKKLQSTAAEYDRQMPRLLH